MEQIVLIIQVIAAITLIILVLIQQGKGAEVGASFGSGASQTIFGSQGSASFITRLTAIMAVIFFVSTLGLGYFATHRMTPQSLDSLLEKVEQQKGEQSQGTQSQGTLPNEKATETKGSSGTSGSNEKSGASGTKESTNAVEKNSVEKNAVGKEGGSKESSKDGNKEDSSDIPQIPHQSE